MSHSMDNKQATSTATKPVGMCEKLFSAFQPTLRPLRRLTFRQQEAAATGPADSLAPAHSDHHIHPIIPHSKPPEPVAPQPKANHNHKHKAEEKKEFPLPAPPKAEMIPLGVPQPLPPPPPPVKEEVQKLPKKGINEKVDDYITRTRGKIRLGSGVGKVASSK